MPTQQIAKQLKSIRQRKCDVCILGAGMAGLTLARQLKQRDPSLDIVIAEHRSFPVADAIHKVGESTVEIASHYLATHLGMREHLEKFQLPKFGLRIFLRGENAITDDIANYDEIGPSCVLPIPTYQLDRGRFENYLADSFRADGSTLLDSTTVRNIELKTGQHSVTLQNSITGDKSRLSCHYLVDASGRRAWLRKANSLSRSARHNNNAVWFRIAGKLNLDEWSSRTEWRNRCHGTERRFSTNHFTGPGYWLWIIPLSSNATSIGLVFDPKFVATNDVRKHEDLIKWLSKEHPFVAQQLQDKPPLDFYLLKNYATTSEQVFSSTGWMTTGDAALFSDPLYSPGGDFIAISNSYITELITGNDTAELYHDYQSYFLSFFTSTMSLYRGQYAGLGNRDFMIAKTIWDYAYYWAVLSKLYFSGKFTDPIFMRSQYNLLLETAALNFSMQRLFRDVAKSARRIGGSGQFYDHHSLTIFHELKNDLLYGNPDNAAIQLNKNLEYLKIVSTNVRRMLEEHERGMTLYPLDQAVGYA